jgi:DNA polymerase III subunit gamma/tau
MTKMRQWSILTAVAVLVVFAAGWFLMIKPQQTKVSNLNSQASSQQVSNQLLQTQIAQLQAEQKNLPKQQQALQKFSTQVPNQAEEPTLIRQLSAAAAGAGVDLISIAPGATTSLTPTAVAPAPAASPSSGTSTTPAAGATSLVPAPAATNQLVELPIAIGVVGTYPNMESFFLAVEKLPRATLVTSWSMCPDPAKAPPGSPGTAATCTLPTTPPDYSFTDGDLGATLNANVFYAPPAATVASGATTGATAPSTTTTPSPATTTTPTAAATATPAS